MAVSAVDPRTRLGAKVGSGVVSAGLVAPGGGPDVREGWVSFEAGILTGLGAGPPPEAPIARADVLLPGFVDQHCHGGGGASFSSAEPAQIRRVADVHLRHGTTTLIASLVSEDAATLLAQVEVLAEAASQGTIAGIHLEGPWIARGRCGAHDPEVLRPPGQVEIEDLLSAGRGFIRQVTLAPELPGAIPAIEQLVGAGVRVAIRHTECSLETAQEAIACGATVATHLWNAMPPLGHRQPGPIAALLTAPEVYLEVVNDGVHVDPAVLRVTLAAAGGTRVVLMTDAMGAADASDGPYRLGGLDVMVTDRVARVVATGAIAGSTLTMDEAVRRARRVLGMGWQDVSLAAAGSAARAMGLVGVGTIEVGAVADLVLLTENAELVAVVKSGVVLPGPATVTV
ncbi:MAG TPA: N-acetylglucosamine-6-phosphate deacetylase [Actinomycetota bacterium]|nr:N-acetylglucosamine-6-phosphate deacetylase [Actinomycetota bacterium]